MGFNIGDVFESMVAAATRTAASEWANIKTVATTQIRNLARHVVDVARGVKNGTIKKLQTAAKLLAMVKNNAIAMIAALTHLVLAAVQRVINAALNAVKQAVNSFAGVALLA
jgi:hypothetical protein